MRRWNWFGILTLAAGLLSGAHPAAAQTTIDTLSTWNPSDSIVYWVPTGRGSSFYGQTFRTPDANSTVLTQVQTYFGVEQTFPADPSYVPAPITGRFSLYQWDSNRVVGSALATSSTFTVANDNAWHLVTIPLAVTLDPSATYVAMFTNEGGGFGRQSYRWDQPYTGGSFYFQTLENGIHNPWLTLGGGAAASDMAIRMDFAPAAAAVPEPSSWVLILPALGVMAFVRRRHAS